MKRSELTHLPTERAVGRGVPHEATAPPASALTTPQPSAAATALSFTFGEGDAVLRLVSSDPFGGVFETPLPRRSWAPGARLVLGGESAGLGRVVIVAAVTGTLGRDGERLGVEWLELAAMGRRQWLVGALGRILGLQARRVSDDDLLGDGRVLVYDAAARQVRLEDLLMRPDLAAAFGAAAPTPRPSDGAPLPRPRTQPRILVDTGRPAAVRPHASPLVVTLGRRSARPMPVFRRRPAAGTFTAGDRTLPMEVTLIGLSHCLFVMEGVEAPEVGADVELTVPLDPVALGQVLLSGTVSLVTQDAFHHRSFVKVDLQARQLPPVYRRLVLHWGRT